MNFSNLIKPNRYTYVSPEVPKPAVSKPPEALAAPGLLSPTQMSSALTDAGYRQANLNAYGQRLGIENGVYGRERLAPLQKDQALTASDIRTKEYDTNLSSFVDNQLRVAEQNYNQGVGIADRYADLQRGTTGALGQAIAGEQANDAARLQLQRDVLMKPKGFTQTLAELTSAIAPIVSLFV